LTHEIDYASGERAGFSSRIIIADRVTFYTKLVESGPTRYFSADHEGNIDKEITKTELDVWLNILADNDAEILEIQKKISLGKKF